MHHLDLVHGLASGDDDRVEFVEQLVVLVLLLVLLLALVVQLLGTVEIVDGEAVIVRRRRPEVRRAVAVLVAGDLVLSIVLPGVLLNCDPAGMRHVAFWRASFFFKNRQA